MTDFTCVACQYRGMLLWLLLVTAYARPVIHLQSDDVTAYITTSSLAMLLPSGMNHSMAIALWPVLYRPLCEAVDVIIVCDTVVDARPFLLHGVCGGKPLVIQITNRCASRQPQTRMPPPLLSMYAALHHTAVTCSHQQPVLP